MCPAEGSVYGDNNLVYLANDWHTGLLPVYLQVLPLCLLTSPSIHCAWLSCELKL